MSKVYFGCLKFIYSKDSSTKLCPSLNSGLSQGLKEVRGESEGFLQTCPLAFQSRASPVGGVSRGVDALSSLQPSLFLPTQKSTQVEDLSLVLNSEAYRGALCPTCF